MSQARRRTKPAAAEDGTPDGDAAAPNGDAATPDGDAATPDGDAAAPDGDAAAPDGDAAAAQAAAEPEEDRHAPATRMLAELHELPEDSPRRQALRDELVESHMPLVVYLARRFSGRNEPMNDLVQVGAIGLIKSIDRFDPSRGLEFSTYATPTILGEIKRHFRDTGWLIHVPRRAQELQTTLNAARADLSQELGRAPTVTELAERIEVAEDAVIEALDAARAYSGVPLDILAAPGETVPEHPMLGVTEEGYEQVEQRALLREGIMKLPESEREILLLRFVANKTQTEIAAIVGVSQMQVSRLVARGLKRLRASLGAPEPEAKQQ